MATKKRSSPDSFQPTMFDIPAAKQVVEVSTKKKDGVASVDVSNIGLNAVWEGRSKTYSSVADYIKKNNIVQ